jgi:plastocyanin
MSALTRLLGVARCLDDFYGAAADDLGLGKLARLFCGLKPPRFPTVFEALINAFACQQVTLSLGIRLLNRLAATCAHGSTTSPSAARASRVSTSTTTPAIRAWRRRTTTWCSGMLPKTMPNSSSLLGRRAVLRAGGLLLAGLAAPALLRPVRASVVVEIRLRSDPLGTHVWFDPIGLLIEPGHTVRWVNEANVHTSTAYDPANDGHALRIPQAGEPWDSGYLVEPGDQFEVTLTVPGVYDYFCAPHEAAGMVGRIIVGQPGGPGTLPFDYFEGDSATRDWRPVPEAAQAAFPPIEAITNQRLVRATA